MKSTGYKRNLNRAYFIIEETGFYTEDYQMRMLKENQIEGLLPVRGKGMDGNCEYHYNISGKVCMKAMYEKAKLRREDIERFIGQLTRTVKNVRNYMLDMNGILLEPECIFYENGTFWFCYYPLNKGSLWEEFHRLSEYFVSQVDYEEKEGVYMAYELHKATMEENYSLEKIMERLEEKQLKEEKVIVEEEENENIDWIGEREMGVEQIREQKDFWNPVKRIKERKKKAKWGEWDDLLLEEDDL